MTSRPWYKRYPKDYLFDTMDLTLEEHGLYNLMHDRYWIDGSLPRDPAEIARTFRIDLRKVRRMLPRLLPYFYEKSGRIHHHRLDLEMEQAIEVSEKNKDAAIKRWHASALPAGNAISESESDTDNPPPYSPQQNYKPGADVPGKEVGENCLFKNFERWYSRHCKHLTKFTPHSWTQSRFDAVRAAWKANPDETWWESYFEACGKRKGLWENENGWKADMFWLIKADSIAKIAEGKFRG